MKFNGDLLGDEKKVVFREKDKICLFPCSFVSEFWDIVNVVLTKCKQNFQQEEIFLSVRDAI